MLTMYHHQIVWAADGEFATFATLEVGVTQLTDITNHMDCNVQVSIRESC